jgi:PAS domain S-box-containing protein
MSPSESQHTIESSTQVSWWATSRSTPAVVAVLFLFTCGIGFLDYLTGPEISFSIFYLIPIILLTWHSGITYAIAYSVISAMIWYIVDSLSGAKYSNPVIGFWNAIVRLGYFSIIALLLTKLKKSIEQRHEIEREKTEQLMAQIDVRKHIEQSLQQTLSMLQATFDATNDGVLVVNLEGNIQTYNKRFVELWKIPGSVIAPFEKFPSWEFAFHELKNSQTFLNKVQELHSKPASESFDILEFNDGRIFECSSRPHRIGEIIVGRVWCFRDVTVQKEAETILIRLNDELEQRVTERTAQLIEANVRLEKEIAIRIQTEEALRASETRFRGLIENSTDGISLVDPEGVILYYSPSASRILGYSFEELKGTSAFNLIHEKDREYIRRLHAELTQKPRTSITSRHRALHKNGTWRWIEGVGYNLLSEPGVNAIVINFRDITDRVQAEEKILLLAHAVESTSEMISITDLQNRCIFVNKAFIEKYGFSQEEIIGREPYMLLASDDNALSKQQRIWDSTRKGGWSGEVLNKKKDGSVFPIHLTTSPIYDTNNNIVGYISVARDISERKNAEQALVQAEVRFKNLYDAMTDVSKEKEENDSLSSTPETIFMGDLANRINSVVTLMQKNLKRTLSFTSFASHELRIPLTILRNQLEGILQPNASAEELHKVLISTYDEVLRLSKIVEDLLNLATLQSGTTKFQLQKLDFRALLKEFYEEALYLARPKNITIVLSHGSPVFIQGDAQKLRQMLFNLLDNALHHTPERGRIRLSYTVTDNTVTFYFSDTGVGIAADQLNMIFNPFYRGSSPTNLKKGTGLGLAIVEWIVEGHNGTIKVESEVGKGTTFIITLPTINSTSKKV